MIFATKHYDITHLPSGMLLHYLGKSKNSNFLQIFCRYGRKCKQIAFHVHGF